MASSGEPDDKKRVVPFPNCSPPSTEPVDKMHLNLASLGLYDDLADEVRLKAGMTAGGQLPKRHGRTVGIALGLVILVMFSIWGHFQSLSLLETLAHNPENLGYDELVAWGNSVVRNVSHLKLVSNVSLAAAFVLGFVWLTKVTRH